MLSLLKTFFNRSFLALFCTQYLGAFNDNFFRTAMATFITYKVTTMADGDKAAVYDKILNNNVRNMLRELEVRRNFYEVYADDYISTFPVDDVRTAYNVAIQKLPERMRRHPSSATQLVRGWVTKMLSRGNVTSAEDAEDVMNAAVNLRNEGFELNPYRESSK